MKKLYCILILSLLLTTTSFAGVKKGKGDVILNKYSLEKFIRYIRGKKSQYPIGFILSSDGSWSTYWFCPERDACGGMNYNPTIKECEDSTGVDCGLFARRYTILWKNGINPGKGKESRIKKKWSDEEIIAKLTELGFLDNNNSSTSTTSKKKTKKYELKGERSIALSWDGYENLIAGTVEFDEADYKGTLKIPLPNNDGTCDGSYSLQKGGKGTWQIACTNNMGAAGTLKWTETGGVTGKGRDHNDNKVKFTVSKTS